jgi:preprotein translocase SecE subunit
MARTRQKRKAKQRQQQQATRRDATAKQQPSNPAEEAAIQTADALESGDELEEIARAEEPAVAAPAPQQVDAAEDGEPVTDGGTAEGSEAAAAAPAPAAPAKRRERRPAPAPAKESRQEKRRERKPTPAERRKEPRQRGRVTNFMVQVWAELRRVQWPDRNQVTQATGVVVVFCFLAGAFLAFWDFVFGELVTSIL